MEPWVNSAQAFGETMDTGCPYVAVGMPKRFLFDLFVGFFKKEGSFKYLGAFHIRIHSIFIIGDDSNP